MIFLVEKKHSEQQRLQRKIYGSGHRNMKLLSEQKYGKE